MLFVVIDVIKLYPPVEDSARYHFKLVANASANARVIILLIEYHSPGGLFRVLLLRGNALHAEDGAQIILVVLKLGEERIRDGWRRKVLYLFIDWPSRRHKYRMSFRPCRCRLFRSLLIEVFT